METKLILIKLVLDQQENVLEDIKENNDKTQKELIEIMTNEGSCKTSKGKSISKQQMSDCIIGLLEEGLIKNK